MKKFVSAALALCLAGAMTACAGGTTTSDSTVDESSSTASVAADSTAETGAAEETSSPETAGEGMSYDEYAAIEVQEGDQVPVTIQAYVQDKQILYNDSETGKTSTSLYLQDQDGAYFAYGVECSAEDYDKLTQGVCVQVSGYKAVWSGEYEIMDGTFTFVDGADTYVAEPVDVTELLGTDELESHQNQYVSFTGMTVVDSTYQDADGNEATAPYLYGWDNSGSEGDDVYFTVSYNGAEYSFLVESDLRGGDSDVYKAAEALQVGQTINCEGFLYWYEGANPHITSITVAE